MNADFRHDLPASYVRIGTIALVVGIGCVALAYLTDPTRASFANLIGLLLLASIASGSVFLVALEYLAGAVWSVPMRRVTEFLAATMPFLLLAALPLFFQLERVFPWIHPHGDAGEANRSQYLNVPFLLVRFGVIYLVWLVFQRLFTRNSVKQDENKDARLTTWNIRLGAVFMPVFAVTITLTAVDWAMSLEPHWYSTIFGVYYFSGTVLAALAAATLIVVLLHERGLLTGLRRDHFYSYGALIFAFTNFWAYIAFSQFLLVWYANIPEETIWFLKRWQHGWQWVSIALIVVRFAIPYAFLLSQSAKMNLRRLKIMAVWVLAGHVLDLYWLVMPAYSESPVLSWMDVGFPLAIFGLVVVVLAAKMRRVPVVPVGDPKLQRGLDFVL
jgi:hypothetical protein